MRLIRFTILSICLAGLLAVSVSGQDTTTFTSWYGGFSVQLPKNATWNGEVGAMESSEGPMTYNYGDSWYVGEMYIQSVATCYDKSDKSINSAGVALRIGRSIAATKTHHSGIDTPLISERPIETNGIKGRELVFKNYKSEIAYRFYQIGKNGVRLRAAYSPKDKKAAFAYFDSIRIVSPNVLEKQKIAENSSSPFTEAAPANYPKDTLPAKGPVAKISRDEQPVNSDGSLGTRKTSYETFYDKNGYATRSVDFHVDWEPPVVRIYGFLEGMRVTRISTNDLYRWSGAPISKSDERYSIREENTFDEKGRMTSSAIFRNDGKLFSKTQFKYGINTIETTSDDTFFGSHISVLDDNGEVISSELLSTKGEVVSRRTYTKYVFDAHRNWTSRLGTRTSIKDGKPEPATSEFEYRTFTYWQ